MSRKQRPIVQLIVLCITLAIFSGCGTTFTDFTVEGGDVFATAPGPPLPPGGVVFFPVVSQPGGVHPNPRAQVTAIPIIIAR